MYTCVSYMHVLHMNRCVVDQPLFIRNLETHMGPAAGVYHTPQLLNSAFKTRDLCPRAKIEFCSCPQSPGALPVRMSVGPPRLCTSVHTNTQSPLHTHCGIGTYHRRLMMMSSLLKLQYFSSSPRNFSFPQADIQEWVHIFIHKFVIQVMRYSL